MSITFIAGPARDYSALMFDNEDGTKIWNGSAFVAASGETLVTPAPNDGSPIVGSAHWTNIAEEKQLTSVSSLYEFQPSASTFLASADGSVDIHIYDVFDSGDIPTYGTHVAEAVDGSKSFSLPGAIDGISKWTVDATGLKTGNTAKFQSTFNSVPTSISTTAKVVGGSSVSGVTNVTEGKTVITTVPLSLLTFGDVVEIKIMATDVDRAYTELRYIQVMPSFADRLMGFSINGSTDEGSAFHAASFGAKWHRIFQNYTDSGASQQDLDALLQAVYTGVIVTGVQVAGLQPRINVDVPPAFTFVMGRREDGTVYSENTIKISPLQNPLAIAFDISKLYPKKQFGENLVLSLATPSASPSGLLLTGPNGPRDNKAIIGLAGGQVAGTDYEVTCIVTLIFPDTVQCRGIVKCVDE